MADGHWVTGTRTSREPPGEFRPQTQEFITRQNGDLRQEAITITGSRTRQATTGAHNRRQCERERTKGAASTAESAQQQEGVGGKGLQKKTARAIDTIPQNRLGVDKLLIGQTPDQMVSGTGMHLQTPFASSLIVGVDGPVAVL